MVDLHSHILPQIDDGSQSLEESLALLDALRAQGVDTVAATPHFYADSDEPQRFLRRRQQAYERLAAALAGRDAPRILLGAELLYFPGFGHSEALPGFCLEGTRLLLLEMPFQTWSRYMVAEVLDLARSGEYRIVLAHIERYYRRQSRRVWDRLLESGLLMQANADFFLSLSSRALALSLLRRGRIHLLGSDCHDTLRRRPRLGEAAALIEKRMGPQVLADMDARCRALLSPGADR